MSVKHLRLKETGDTIVEVMVVLAVLGLAVSIAYATATKSLTEARQAQENSYASELVQEQIEALRDLGQIATPPATQNIYITSKFCIVYNPAPTNSYTVTTFSSSPPSFCTMPFAPTSSAISVYYCGGTYPSSGNALCSGLSNDTFVVQANWPDVGSQGTDYITQEYRVHPLP